VNVALYHPWVYLKGGAERTILELMSRSEHRWTLYTNHYDPEGTFPEFRDHHVVELERVSVRRTIRDVGSACLRVITQRLPVDDVDALMISSEGLGNLAVLRPPGVRTFCFCHTPLKVVYDPFTRQRYFTQQQPGMVMRTALACYVQVDRLGWRRYERVFCNSREVAGRVLNAKLVPEEKVEVLYPGVDTARFLPAGPQEPIFLIAGRIARTKHVDLGIDAFLQLKAASPRAAHFRLLIAGMVDEKSQSYLTELRARAAGRSDVEFILNPTDEALLNLYGRCYATVFTALNEDWGLVTLEGMASAKPVIAVARGGPLESIVHGETGFLCPPEPEAFAGAMTTLVDDVDLARRLGLAGRERAASFSWETFVQRIDSYVATAEARATVPITEAPSDPLRGLLT
jgi:glycosyltransferase involved in cell wall biosynthesis